MNDLSGNSETLALSPPSIFGSVSDVKTDDPNVEAPLVGAPLRLTEKGYLEVVVSPPFPAADKLTLQLNGKPIDAPSEVDAQERTRFRVSRALLREGAQSFHYLAERGSGNTSEPSPKLWVLYSLNRPGGRDPFGGNDVQDNLKIDLPEAIKKLGVGPEEAAQGVPLTVSYPFAKLHDVVEVNCNGYTFTYPVTQNDLGGSFDIQIPEEAFIGGGSSEAFQISYRVWDQLENYTQDGLPSIALSIVVDLKPKEMDRPDLIEDLAGDEDDADTIDRSILKDFLLARVHVRTPLWTEGDSVRLTYTCVPAAGAPVTRTLADVPVNRVPDFLELKMPAAEITAAAWVIVSYSQVRNGQVVAGSYPTKSEVVGDGSSELPAPLVPGLVGNSIAPTKYPEGFTVRVDWATGWKVGDKAKLVVTGGASGVGTPVFGFVVFNTNFRANFKLSRDFIMANANREVVFKWVLLRDGKETESQPLTLTVERVNASDPNFPSAEISQANGTEVVDLRLFKGDAQVVCAPWPFISMGQHYWLHVLGTGLDDNAKVVEIANGESLTEEQVNKGLDHVLSRKELELFKPGNQLTVRLRVDLYPNENADTIVTFLLKRYILVVAGMDDSLEFLNAPYIVAPTGRLTDIELKAVDANGDFIKQKSIYVTIPDNFKYAEGSSGRREFKTGFFGEVIIKGVTAPDAPGTSYTVKTELDGKAFIAKLDVTARGWVGELDIGFISNPITVSPDGTKICAISPHHIDGKLVVIDTLSLKVLSEEKVNGYYIAVGPDSNRVFVSSYHSNSYIVINLAAGGKVLVSAVHDSGNCIWSREGVYAYVLASYGRLVKVDTILGRTTSIVTGNRHFDASMIISPDGQNIFFCGSDAFGHIYKVSTASLAFIRTTTASTRGAGIAISPDSKRLYVSFYSDQKIRVFDSANLLETRSVDAFKPGVNTLSPDGRLLYIASEDAKVRAFDTVSFQVVKTFDVAGDPKSLALSPDGSRLYVAYKTKTIITVIQVG
ncbi:YncE family protein [Pseudomonas sp. NPDC099000]|uniref:YncE family protein n=1 Tax=Pseudomonas sp. NPDC099000 TaxID=3364488 RepID=UPI00383AD89C